MVCEKTFKEFLQVCRDERSPKKNGHICLKCFREKKKLKESLLVHRVKIN